MEIELSEKALSFIKELRESDGEFYFSEVEDVALISGELADVANFYIGDGENDYKGRNTVLQAIRVIWKYTSLLHDLTFVPFIDRREKQ